MEQTKETKKPVERKLTGTVNCAFLNMRKEDDLNSEIVKILLRNQKVVILGKAKNGFIQVRIDSLKGYCMSQFISEDL